MSKLLLTAILSLCVSTSVSATGLVGSVEELQQRPNPLIPAPKTATSSVNIGYLHINGQWYSQVAVTYSDGTTEIQRIPVNTNQY